MKVGFDKKLYSYYYKQKYIY